MPIEQIDTGPRELNEPATEAEVEAAWRRARPIAGRDPALYRIAPDIIRSVIRRDCYEVRGKFGWQIECGQPVALRETTIDSAIRALQSDYLSASGWPADTAAGDRSPG